MIAIVVATYNRAHLLVRCVENVLMRTSDATREIIIWNNASSDESASYLESVDDPRVRVVHHPENIAQNAFARAFRLTSSPYLVTLADDIIGAPMHWDALLLDAFRRLPEIGFLGADLLDDEHDEAAHLRYRVRPHAYAPVDVNGVRLLEGPTAGWCAITSRDIYDQVGGFQESRKRTFWAEDAAYIADIARIGYRAAILRDLRVHHAGGPFYAEPNPAKLELAELYLRQARRKNAAKRFLLSIPYVGLLNERRRWFRPPELWWQEYLEELTTTYREALAAPKTMVDAVAAPEQHSTSEGR